MSGSATHAPRSIQGGPTCTHPDTCPQVEEHYMYESSLSTQDDAIQYYGLRGCNRSDSEYEGLNVPEDSQPPGPPPPGRPGTPPPGPPGPPPPRALGPLPPGPSGR
jgi:hypothetical protein